MTDDQLRIYRGCISLDLKLDFIPGFHVCNGPHGAGGVQGRQISMTSTDQTGGAKRSTGRVFLVIASVLSLGLAAVWSLAAVRQLSASLAVDADEHLDRARVAFQAIRARTLDGLRTLCRVMVEDPRLKSTLATEGVDQATVADILADLAKLRRSGFLIILSPDGKAFAEAGAVELRGLDLSGSSPVKAARGSADAVTGSWVIGSKVMDLSIMGVRFGTQPIAYLVVGQAIDQDVLRSVAEQTGVAVATASGETITLSSAPDDALRPVFTAVARQAGSFRGRVLEHDGQTYATAVFELEDIAQARPRLVVMQSLAHAVSSFELVRWLIFIPPLLVLITLVLALTARRTLARHP
ncbi:MAG TPA: cache domain-containing protein [Kofleriaceae bacterium]|nr:cache domain-containing protein [Kofleriaceae bacterium]